MNRGLLGYPLGRGQYQKGLGFPQNALRSQPQHSGVQVLADATAGSAHVKGSWVLSGRCPTDFNADGFSINFLGDNIVADFLVDIALGDGQENIVVSNLLYTSGVGFNSLQELFFPIAVPANTAMSMRVQSTDGGALFSVGNWTMHRGEPYRSLHCRRSQTYGANTGDSGGTQVDTSGVNQTYGAWVTIADPTIDPIRFLHVCIGGQNNATRADGDHYFDVGYGQPGSEVVLVGTQYFRQVADTDTLYPAHRSYLVNIPAGQRLAIRQRSGVLDATDRLVDFSIVAFGP